MAGDSGGWMVVYTGEGLSDRSLGRTLQERGFTYACESSSWVLLNDFNGLTQIPLDQYNDVVEPFDPRNDGYAQRLRSFFVSSGIRRIFIERRGGSFRELEDLLNTALGPGRAGAGETPGGDMGPPGGEPGVFWVAGFNPGGGRFWILGLFFVLSGLCVFFAGAEPVFAFLCILPVLVPLVLSGPGGIAAAGILEALFFLLREPLLERFRSVRGASRVLHHSLREELAGWFHTFPRELGGALAALGLYWGICLLGDIPLFTAFPVICFLVPALLLPPWAESQVIRNIFFPLPIRKGQWLLLFPPPLPLFTLAFGVVLFFSATQGNFSFSGNPLPGPSSGIWPPPPGQEAYEAHARFQSSFSRRSLRKDGAPYGTYTLGADGLIAEFTAASPEGNIPPYPDLPDRIYRETAGGSSRPQSLGKLLVILGILIGLSVPALLGMTRYSKKKRTVV
jgi:hypothetical protein